MAEGVDPRVLALLDKQEIYEALMRYCRAIDRCDEELLRTVYHPDAWDDHGTFNGPASEFIPWVMQGLHERFTLTTHIVTNVLIEVEGDTGHSESYVNSFHLEQRDGQEWEWVFSGRYVDRFERRNGAWKIARRTTVFDWESMRPATTEKVLHPGEFDNVGCRSRADAVYSVR